MAVRIKYMSPKGEVYYPSLRQTKTYKGKDLGYYVCNLLLAGDALEKVRADIDKFLTDTYGAAKAAQVWKNRSPIKTTDGGQSYIIFRAWAQVKGKSRKVAIYDSRALRVTRELNIGAGSIVKIRGSLSAFPAEDPGAAFFMDGIQVIKYVEFIPRAFPPDEEGDFVADEPPDDDGPVFGPE
jgi:hypothetical protein